MLRTITIGQYISVQGNYVRSLPDGSVEVRVGEKVFAGLPVSQPAAA
ncbi:hypothetical protein ACX9MO_07925 [Pseudooceanicola sp. 502str34]